LRNVKNEKANDIDQPDSPAIGGDWRPVPDPTALTTQQLRREILSLRELLEVRIDGDLNLLRRALQSIDDLPAAIDLRVDHLKELHDEKFKSVQVQFAERDTRTEQNSRDSKVAVDAALQAAKEAVEKQDRSNGLAIAKSEAATVKLLDQLGDNLKTTASGFDSKINDLKDRLTLIEGRAVGQSAAAQTQQATVQTQQTSSGLLIALSVGVIGTLIAVGSLIVSIMHH
jgi:cation transport regulator ChaB